MVIDIFTMLTRRSSTSMYNYSDDVEPADTWPLTRVQRSAIDLPPGSL